MPFDPRTIDHFLIYLGLYRLAIVLAGVAGMWLGYLLFRRGLAPDHGGSADADASFEAAVGSNTLALKGAAPGTFFALFGAGLIVAMVVTGAPEVTLAKIRDAGAGSGDSTDVSDSGGSDQIVVTLRSQEISTIRVIERELNDQRIDYEQAYRRLRRLVKPAGGSP